MHCQVMWGVVHGAAPLYRGGALFCLFSFFAALADAFDRTVCGSSFHQSVFPHLLVCFARLLAAASKLPCCSMASVGLSVADTSNSLHA